MRTWGLSLAIVLVLISACSRTPATASLSPRPPTSSAASAGTPSPGASASPAASASPSASAAPATSPSSGVAPPTGAYPSPSALPHVTPAPHAWSTTSSYGLLQWANAFGLVNTSGNIAASFSMAPSSVLYCSWQHEFAALGPAISSTRDAIYFRDGDTKIRSLAPSGAVTDVTTVPGGPNVVSFFSVSPDDQRIAVVYEDLSNPYAMVHLYIENLVGGGNHVSIVNTPVGQAVGTTMWPLGWHAGDLVIAVVPICTSSATVASPLQYQVLNPTTGVQDADLSGQCSLSDWPSPAGVTCTNPGVTSATIIDWAGRAVAVGSEPGGGQSGLSTTGDKFFVATGDVATAQYYTWIVRRSSSVSTPVNEHASCLWIDNDHVMAPDAVISATINSMGFPDGAVINIAQPGGCAGRFPGGL